MRRTLILAFCFVATMCAAGESKRRVKRLIHSKAINANKLPADLMQSGDFADHRNFDEATPTAEATGNIETKSEHNGSKEQKDNSESAPASTQSIFVPTPLISGGKTDAATPGMFRSDNSSIDSKPSTPLGSITLGSSQKIPLVSKSAVVNETVIPNHNRITEADDNPDHVDLIVMEEEPTGTLYRQTDSRLKNNNKWQQQAAPKFHQKDQMKSSLENAFQFASFLVNFGLDGFRPQTPILPPDDLDSMDYYFNVDSHLPIRSLRPPTFPNTHFEQQQYPESDASVPTKWNFIENLVSGFGDSSCPLHRNYSPRETTEPNRDAAQADTDTENSKLIQVCSCRLVKKKP